MIDLPTFQKLKTAVEQKQREAERAAGQLEQLNKQFKEEHGFDLIDGEKVSRKAEELLSTSKKEQEEMEIQYQAEMESFEKEYGHLLDGE